MDVIYLLVAVSAFAVAVVAVVLIGSVRSGQYDDLDGAAWRIVLDDDAPDTDLTVPTGDASEALPGSDAPEPVPIDPGQGNEDRTA